MSDLIDFHHEGVEAGVLADDGCVGAIVLPRQNHSCHIGIIENDSAIIPEFPDTDAILSFRSGIKVGVRTADCVPLLLYAPDIRCVAAVHAGWKGTLGGIAEKAASLMIRRGADPALMLAAMGPCICRDCYEVSEELASTFADAGFSHCIARGRHLDLPAVNRCRLLAQGLLPHHIAMPAACTRTTPSLPSWRREPGITGRMVTWIGLR